MDIAGQWDITINSPMGAQSAKLDLKVDGSSLTGTMSSPQGSVEIEDGKIDGDSATWSAKVPSPPITLSFTASVNGDEISGNAALGAFGNAGFKGTRAG